MNFNFAHDEYSEMQQTTMQNNLNLKALLKY